MKFLKLLGLLLSFVPLAALAGPGGSTPFTVNQFPVFYLSSAGVTNVTSSAETNMFQALLPNNFLGNNGVLRVTASLAKGATTNNGTFKFYIGGSGNPPTGGTVVNTNTLVASSHNLIQFYVAGGLNGVSGSVTNVVIGQTTTNTYNTTVFNFYPTFSTQTNGLNFTVTGTSDGTNALGLDFLLVEAIGGL